MSVSLFPSAGEKITTLVVLDFQQHPHGGSEGNALVAHQGQHLVVVHDGVHGFNPCGIDIAVQHHPLVQVSALVASNFLLAHSENS